jgi:hypothetical protein
VIQDDAQVCANFSAAVTQIAASNPDTPVVLFLAQQPRRTALLATRAMKARQRYVNLFIRDFCPVVGMLWPREKTLQLLDWSEKGKLPGGLGARSDDAVVGRWMLTTRQTIRATVPSLVQHPGTVPSVKGSDNASSRFTALFFAEDGLHYEW